jgi:hypothetical protein
MQFYNCLSEYVLVVFFCRCVSLILQALARQCFQSCNFAWKKCRNQNMEMNRGVVHLVSPFKTALIITVSIFIYIFLLSVLL